MKVAMPRTMNRILREHIRLPGAPQIVVSRAYAYRWLLAAGYDPRARGFASVDYMVFYPGPLDEPLTDLEAPETAAFLSAVERDMRGEGHPRPMPAEYDPMTDDRDTDPDPPEPRLPREGE
jgi:hypothetical protein